MQFLRQSTAGQIIEFGPLVDSTDGNTPETALTVANTDIRLRKHNATSEVAATNGGTHTAAGRFYTTTAAADVNTPGNLTLSVHVAGALAVKTRCFVLPAAVFDVLIGPNAPSTLTPTEAQAAAASALTAYGPAKPGDAMTASNMVDPAPTPAEIWTHATRTLSAIDSTATQAAAAAALTAYGPAKPGDAMTASNMVDPAPTPAEIWSHVTRTLTSAGAGGATATEIWTHPNRTLTAIDSTAIQAAVAAALTAYGPAKPGDAMTASNMVDPAPDSTAIQAAVAAALTAYTAVKVADLAGITVDAPTPAEIWTHATRTLTALDLSGVTVDALSPEQIAMLEAIFAKTAMLGMFPPPVQFAPVTIDGDVGPLIVGDDYLDDRAPTWQLPTEEVGDLTGATATFTAAAKICGNRYAIGPVTAALIDPGGPAQAARVPLAATETTNRPGTYQFALTITTGGESPRTITARTGDLLLTRRP